MKAEELKVTKNINCPVTPSFRDEVLTFAASRGLSISDVVRLAVREYISRNKAF